MLQQPDALHMGCLYKRGTHQYRTHHRASRHAPTGLCVWPCGKLETQEPPASPISPALPNEMHARAVVRLPTAIVRCAARHSPRRTSVCTNNASTHRKHQLCTRPHPHLDRRYKRGTSHIALLTPNEQPDTLRCVRASKHCTATIPQALFEQTCVSQLGWCNAELGTTITTTVGV